MKRKSEESIRKRSVSTLAGLPLFDIAYGPDADLGEKQGSAHGIIAIGDEARGWLALGGISVGLISLGGLALGAVALGGLAVGGVAVGGLAAGALSVDRRPRTK